MAAMVAGPVECKAEEKVDESLVYGSRVYIKRLRLRGIWVRR